MTNEKTTHAKTMMTTIPAETIILREGEDNFEMYKVLKGKVEIYTGYGTDNEVLLGILGEGACFGEFGLLTHKPAIYTVIAYSDLVLYRVTEEKIGEFIQENHSSVLQIMKSMANTMMLMQHQINQLSEELDDRNKVNKRIVGKNKDLISRYVNGGFPDASRFR